MSRQIMLAEGKRAFCIEIVSETPIGRILSRDTEGNILLA